MWRRVLGGLLAVVLGVVRCAWCGVVCLLWFGELGVVPRSGCELAPLVLCQVLAQACSQGVGHVAQTTPVGFEPTRGDPIGLAGRRLSHSAKVSMSQF